MNVPHASTIPWFRLLVAHWWRWLIPAVVIAAGGAAYAHYGPVIWESAQALFVRNEAVNNQQGPGKFSHSDQMKVVQETILEIGRSPTVLTQALTAVGPPADHAGSKWPAAVDLEDFRAAVRIVPPKGAEYGKTEIIYLKVRDRDPARARRLSDAICAQLEEHFQNVRDATARNMIAELEQAALIARADLRQSTKRLAELEAQVGSNLGELRMLGEGAAADSALRRTQTEVAAELRQAHTATKTNDELLALLQATRHDPQRLVALPNRLLDSQPALRQLQSGLTEAQIRRAGFEGRMATAHPLVQAAREAELHIQQQIHAELDLAIRALQADGRLNDQRVALLETQQQQLTAQMSGLAEVRATYAGLVAEVRSREQLVQRAEQNLADARGAQVGAKAGSLVNKVDAPDTGTRPVGPSPAMIVLCGMGGGLLVGLGVFVLTVPITPINTARGRLGFEPPSSPLQEWAGGSLSLKEALARLQAAKHAAPASG